MENDRSAVSRIMRFHRGRDPERVALKYKKMQKDPLAFFRGTCHLYCEDWPATTAFSGTPDVWVCGDLHVENFGAYLGNNRLIYFDIADFDESLLAPCAWDLTRLSTSVLLAAKLHGVKRKSALALCHCLLDAYALALRDGKARWLERGTAVGLIKSVLHSLEAQTPDALLAERTKRGSDGRKLAIDSKHTLPIDDASRKRIKRFFRDFAEKEPHGRPFKLLDVARRVAGTGALGLERYTLLVEHRGETSGRWLLDLKWAAPSALASRVTKKQPKWSNEAERIVAAAHRAQAISPALLQAVTIDAKSYVLRELMPTQDKLDLKHWRGASEGLNLLARDLGFLVAWSELRSGGRDGSATSDELSAFAQKVKWRQQVVDYAEHYVQVAWHDWETFRTAYRDKALPN